MVRASYPIRRGQSGSLLSLLDLANFALLTRHPFFIERTLFPHPCLGRTEENQERRREGDLFRFGHMEMEERSRRGQEVLGRRAPSHDSLFLLEYEWTNFDWSIVDLYNVG